MRPILSRCLALIFCALALAAPARAQADTGTAALPEPPVRYDEDVLPPAFHEGRRSLVLNALPDDAVAVFLSAPERTRENDVRYEYRQDSDLYYLTGTTEPGSVLLLAPGGIEADGRATQELLLVPPRTTYSDVWLGRRFGPERAEEELGLANAVSNERFEEVLTGLVESGRRVYLLPLPEGVEEETALAEQLATLRQTVQTMDAGEDALAQEAIDLMRAVDAEERFEEVQAVLKERMAPSSFETGLGKAMYRRFTDAATLDEWQTWRREHVEARYADDTFLRPLLTELRMVKTDEELELLRKAIDLTVTAQKEAMRSIEPGMHEYEVEALIEYIFKRGGAEHTGFPSIIGSGENATVLHYEANRRQMEEGDMLVMDVGAEVHGYSADVTRSVPVSGTFSREQRAIYELVFEAQKAGIEAAQPGAPFGAPGRAARQIIAEGLMDLGLIDGADEAQRFFMHGTSHYLGLYVHDVGTGGPLQPGTVITVEPGLYISPAEDIPEKWWNIGVRIEDDVLVTADGPVNLSKDAPRSVAAVERLMAEEGLASRVANGR